MCCGNRCCWSHRLKINLKQTIEPRAVKREGRGGKLRCRHDWIYRNFHLIFQRASTKRFSQVGCEEHASRSASILSRKIRGKWENMDMMIDGQRQAHAKKGKTKSSSQWRCPHCDTHMKIPFSVSSHNLQRCRRLWANCMVSTYT